MSLIRPPGEIRAIGDKTRVIKLSDVIAGKFFNIS